MQMTTSVNDRYEDSLRASVKEGITTAASSRIAWEYITPYALHLGATNKEIGFLGVLQSLGSALAQIPGARLVGRFSRKTIWNASYIISRLFWIPVILLLFLPYYQIAVLMLAVFGITFLNGLRNPAWTSLMGDIVPKETRGEYFGKRNMVIGISGLLTTMIGGMLLVIFGFSILFILAIFIGMISVYFFNKIYEPPVKREFHFRHSFDFSIKDLAIEIKTNKTFMWFTAYIAIVSFAIAMSSPFYSVYMLKNLGIDYLWYAIVISINAIVMIFSQPYWGKFSDKFGDRSILIITSIMICFIPFMWMLVSGLPMLVVIHIFDGFAFGGWSLVIFNFLLSSVPVEKKAYYVANHSFIAGIATVLGTLTASLVIEYFETVLLLGASSLMTVFMISFVIRLGSLAFLPKIQENYQRPEQEPLKRLAWRLTVVEPAKSLYKFAGHIYDVKWFFIELKKIPYKIYTYFLYKVRIYRADKN